MATRSCDACSLCVWCFLAVSFTMVVLFHTALHPSDANISIQTASLTHAVNINRSVVVVNFTANVNVRNPSWGQGVYYKRVEADAYYKGGRLRGSGTMPPFYVGRKSNTVVSAAFWSESCYDCTDPGKVDDCTGRFNVDLWICPYEYEYKLGWLTLTDHYFAWRCEFILRLAANQTAETEFTSNPCYQPTLGKFDSSGC